jgi:hypothetical protein
MMRATCPAEHAGGPTLVGHAEGLSAPSTGEHEPPAARASHRTSYRATGGASAAIVRPALAPTEVPHRGRDAVESSRMTREMLEQRTRPRGRRRGRRTVKKLVSYTPEEFRAVVAGAATCGRTPARFIREASLGAAPQARRNETADESIRQLARIGNRLNELAREAQASGQFVDEAMLETMLTALNATIDRIA